jgi:cytosine/adenosine deaminase-related metal-dependent hydrolase
VVRQRQERTLEQVQADVRAGIAESLRCGTTLVGDIAAGGASWDALAASPLRAVVFHEILGLPRDRVERTLADAHAWLAAHPPTPTCRPGLSPHAPYSVSAFGFRNACRRQAGTALPVTTHLAETLAEQQLLASHYGPFVAFLGELGVWAPDELVRDWDEVLHLTADAAPVLYAHANYLSANSAMPSHGSVVYGPRTHAAFGHPPHPFRDFLARGVRVVLGTDSLASNPDLNLLAEARFLHRLYPDVSPEVLLRMATLGGAEALGWQEETGSLTPGKSADLVVVPLPDESAANPHHLLLAADAAVRQVWCRGLLEKNVHSGEAGQESGANPWPAA